jgi:ectoine hydroxylase-related dioxygenase (phytanoyl-CoA dioxygenase family)
MTDLASLTDNQVRTFQRDGYLIVRGLFGADEITACGTWIDELAARPPSIGREMVYFEDSLAEKGARVLSRIERFAQYHTDLGRLVADSRILGPVGDLLGDEAVLFKEKVNFKLPGGGGFAPHQDIQPGWDTYAPYFVSVLVAVDPNTLENGCLELAVAHHTRGMIGRKWAPLEGDELSGIEFVPYPMDPGDVAFFDCFTPHQSKPNLTGRPRRNIYLTYNRRREGDFREQYFADKRKSYPPDYERDPNALYVFRV